MFRFPSSSDPLRHLRHAFPALSLREPDSAHRPAQASGSVSCTHAALSQRGQQRAPVVIGANIGAGPFGSRSMQAEPHRHSGRQFPGEHSDAGKRKAAGRGGPGRRGGGSQRSCGLSAVAEQALTQATEDITHPEVAGSQPNPRTEHTAFGRPGLSRVCSGYVDLCPVLVNENQSALWVP